MNVDTNLFDTKEKQSKAMSDLESLRVHPGWQLIEQILSNEIKTTEEDILHPDTEIQNEKDLKIKRVDFLYVRSLPVELLKMLREQMKEVQTTDDVYA